MNEDRTQQSPTSPLDENSWKLGVLDTVKDFHSTFFAQEQSTNEGSPKAKKKRRGPKKKKIEEPVSDQS